MNQAEALIEDLRTGMIGRVVTAHDGDYDQLRSVAVGGVNRRPAAIARVANAADVQHVMRIARAHDAELAVRSGGHDGLGRSVSEGGVVLDVRDMKRIDIDPDRRDTESVGIGGITLGGRIGYQCASSG